MEHPTVLLTNLTLRLNRASDAMLSQVHDDCPASPAECQRVHDRLLGAWSACISARRFFSESELARLNSLEERVVFAARTLRGIR